LSPDPEPLLWPALLLQLTLILVNAVFSASEIALIQLNENKLRRQADQGDKIASRLLRMVEKPTRFLSTIQICITFAGFLGSAFASSHFAAPIARWLVSVRFLGLSYNTCHTVGVVLITIALSYFSLVLGELAPKRLAMQFSEKIARFTVDLLSGFAFVFTPMVRLLSGSTNTVLKALGVNPNASPEHVTEEEIRLMVDVGEEKGAIETSEREMIENVFEFNNTTAAEVMTHRTDMTAVWIGDTQETIISTIQESGLSRFPVYDEDLDDIIGVLSTRTYLLNARQNPPLPLRDLLREPVFVPETVKTDALFRDMQKKKTHLAIVVDEYGGTSGLVTMEDLLEEIVGNIYDEFDPKETQDIVQIDDNHWRVEGSVPLDTLAKTLDVDLPDEEEYSTLGGLAFSQLTVIPQDGSEPEIETNGLLIHVDKIEDRRVVTATVSIVPRINQKEPEES
jgi:putative hemolysin